MLFLLAPQNFFHLSALGQFIDQLVQIPYFLRQWIFNLLYPIPTDHPGDEVRIWVQGCLLKEGVKGRFFINEFLQSVFIKTGQPFHH